MLLCGRDDDDDDIDGLPWFEGFLIATSAVVLTSGFRPTASPSPIFGCDPCRIGSFLVPGG